MKLHKQFAIVIAEKHRDVIWTVNSNYTKIVDEFKKYKKLNPDSIAWIQTIIS